MRSLFEPAAASELKDRLSKLRPESQRQWGKMSLAQALAHCSEQMEMVLGRKFTPRSLMGRVFGRFAKAKLLSEEPMPRDMPTDKNFVVNDERDLGSERDRLRTLIDEFVVGGPAGCTKHPHSFMGPMTPNEWATLMYKHFDHHLRQFGV